MKPRDRARFRESCEIRWNESCDPMLGGSCERCRRPLMRDQAQFHHKQKRSQGGGHGPDNIEILCLECHGECH